MITTKTSPKRPSKEDFLIAKKIVEGKTTSGSSAQKVFNNTFKWLEKHISRTYLFQDKSFLDEYSKTKNADYTRKIMMPGSFYKEDSSSQSDNEDYTEKDIEISIGEFILVSLRTWNSEKAEYLTYIRYLLQNCKWCVRKDIPADKARAIRNARRLIINKYNLPKDISDEEVLKTIMYSPAFSAEQKELYMHILSKDISLYTPISSEKDGDNGSTELIDFIQGMDSGQPDLAPSDGLEDIIGIYHQSFLKTQARTRPCLIVYITVTIYEALEQSPSFLDYFASRYPDMIDSSLFQWIDETIQKNIAEMTPESKGHIEAAYPSSRQQAQKAGKEQHSYLNIIKRFKNSVEAPLEELNLKREF